MNIGVIGAGFVGSAVINAHINDQVVVRDPKISKSADLNEFADCQAIYICVPSPSKGHGHCDTSILESVLDELHTLGFNNIPLISKVTAPPSAYEKLQKLYPNLVYAPEFLTARNSIIDYKYSQLAIVGGQQLWANAAAEIIVRGLDSICKDDVVITDIKTASLYKYLMNSYLAMKVTFMNEFYQLATSYDISWLDIREILSLDNRIGDTHTDVPGPDGEYGWGGFCFPKDIAAICEDAIDQGIEFNLMQQVEIINQKHRKNNDKPI